MMSDCYSDLRQLAWAGVWLAFGGLMMLAYTQLLWSRSLRKIDGLLALKMLEAKVQVRQELKEPNAEATPQCLIQVRRQRV